MAKEAAEQEAEENKEGEEGGGNEKMFNKAGLIVLVVTNVLLIGAFVVYLIFINRPSELPDELKEKQPKKNVMDLNAPRLNIEKPIIVSIPTNELATEFRHLAITLTILIGRLEGEFDPDFDLNKQLAKEQFLETAEKFIPFVEDSVNAIALSYTYLELQEETTRQDFKRRLIDNLNNRLREYNLKPRVTDILLKQFIFSD